MDMNIDLFQLNNGGTNLDPLSEEIEQSEEEIIQSKILLWKKIDPIGYQPASREGHTAVSCGYSTYVFGGFEGGKRVNSTLVFDALTSSWSVLDAHGLIPSPRAYHTACMFGHLMIIHGGEGLKDTSKNSEKQYGTSGICPGDSIQGTKLTPAVKVGIISSDPSEGNLVNICYDDMYALDTLSNTWYCIQCSLAPLPRKGHTMNLLNLYGGKPHIVVFGGYSIDNATLSNTVLICEAQKIVDFYEISRKAALTTSNNQQPSPPNQKRSFGQLNKDLIPISVVWRTVQCKGIAPSPRYRHSTTAITEVTGESLLVVLGGIGKDPTISLNDVYILDVENMNWVTVKTGNDGLSKGIAGDGPVGGIFAHVAFSIKKPQISIELNEEQGNELLVFGGSSNPNNMKAFCYSSIFAFDLTNHIWRKVSTGHTFPTSRANHSINIIDGWTPEYQTPFSSSLPNQGPIHIAQSPSKTTAFIFGGVGATMYNSDIWALDLQYRDSGVNQYDNNTKQLVQFQLDQYNLQDEEINNRFDEALLAEIDDIEAMNLLSATPSTQKIFTFNNSKYLQRNNSNYTNGSMRGSQSLPALVDQGADLDDDQLRIQKEMSDRNLLTSEFPSEHGLSASKLKLLQHIKIANNVISKMQHHPSSDALSSESLFHDLANSSEKKHFSDIVLKVRKERAVSDISLAQEREKNMMLEKRVEVLTHELKESKDMISQLEIKANNEKEDLEKKLLESQAKMNQLLEMNQEILQLITLMGIDQLPAFASK